MSVRSPTTSAPLVASHLDPPHNATMMLNPASHIVQFFYTLVMLANQLVGAGAIACLFLLLWWKWICNVQCDDADNDPNTDEDDNAGCVDWLCWVQWIFAIFAVMGGFPVQWHDW